MILTLFDAEADEQEKRNEFNLEVQTGNRGIGMVSKANRFILIRNNRLQRTRQEVGGGRGKGCGRGREEG